MGSRWQGRKSATNILAPATDNHAPRYRSLSRGIVHFRSQSHQQLPTPTNPPTVKTPVIVLSGNDDQDARARALAQGADDYLVKLPAKHDLIACIRRHAVAATAN